MKAIRYAPIGIVHTPYKQPEGIPIQPSGGRGVRGTIQLDPEFADGLKDLAGFSHIVLITHLHLSKGYELEVIPFLDDRPRGLFATRSPRRPNPIGLSVVKLVKVAGNILHIEGIDMVDGTPLLDIKPYLGERTFEEEVRLGWFAEKKHLLRDARADRHFR